MLIYLEKSFFWLGCSTLASVPNKYDQLLFIRKHTKHENNYDNNKTHRNYQYYVSHFPVSPVVVFREKDWPGHFWQILHNNSLLDLIPPYPHSGRMWLVYFFFGVWHCYNSRAGPNEMLQSKQFAIMTWRGSSPTLEWATLGHFGSDPPHWNSKSKHPETPQR